MTRARIALVGASGFFGKPLFSALSDSFDVIGTGQTRPEKEMVLLDICDAKAVRDFFSREKPELVVNLAAITDVDACEKNPEQAQAVHVSGTQNLADACQKSNCRFFYFSTDFVFDGTKGNYSESDPVNPINVYGKTKWEGEKIAQTVPEHLIIRTSTPYSQNLESKKFINIL